MPSDSPVDWNSLVTLPRSTKTVVVLDLVESVRLMEQDEVDIVHRWQAVQHAVGQVLAQHQGRLVKSLGDGMMLEFDQPQTAAQCALAVQAAMPRFNKGYAVDRQMLLRIGIHTTQVYTDAIDIYGSGVNLAARLATLAGPGEIVVSSEVRDSLTDGLDGAQDDLGECYLKHVAAPVRTYRIGPSGPKPVVGAQNTNVASLQPTIAVIPFDSQKCQVDELSIGDLIADGVIGQLSRTRELRVISRLSTKAFRGRQGGVGEVEAHLKANYVLSGSYVLSDRKLLIVAELSHAHNGQVLWAERIARQIDDLFQVDSEICNTISQSCVRHMLDNEVQKALLQPMPTLQGYSLLLGGINLMHRSGSQDFARSGELLDHLIQRYQRSTLARAWRAKWYVLNVTRGMSSNKERDALLALDHTQRALDSDPNHSLSLAIEGFIYCHLKNDLDTARQRVSSAIDADASNSLGWLFSGTIHSLLGETKTAVTCSENALHLSPLDPLKYYYLSLAGSVALFDQQYSLALNLLHESWRLNKFHSGTSRTLAITYAELGDMATGRMYLQLTLKADPSLTVRSYLERLRCGDCYRKRFANALASLGLPLQ